jgi:hypothetical protein
VSRKSRVIGSAGGALGLGTLAAAIGACCGLPWAVALLGVSGAVALARLAFLLPYALAGAGVLLALALWWAYRPPAVCDDGSCDAAARRPLRWIVWGAAVLVVGLATYALAGQDPPTGSASYTVLDDPGSELRADFNRSVGSVRLLFVVDPICPTCLRGLDDLNDALLGHTQDPRLRTFVVYVPVLHPPALPKDIPPAAQLLHNANVRHYWNPSGSFGNLLSKAVGLKSGNRQLYAWDVWLIYGPEAKWEGADPPRPRLLMQQLGALRGSTEFPHLDSQAFARQVQALLAQLPPSPRPAAAASQTRP